MKTSAFCKYAFFYLFVIYTAGMKAAAQNPPAKISLTVYPDSILHAINPTIYGDLLEHIYHSINGGLWGEMIASRSFEPENPGGWQLEKDAIVSGGNRKNALFMGDSSWTDYELKLETQWRPYFIGVPAPWSGGGSDTRIVFRGTDTTESYALHIDASSNTPFSIQKNVRHTGKDFDWEILKTCTAPLASDIAGRTWHRVTVNCVAGHIIIYWDEHKLFDYTDAAPVLHGAFGFVLTGTTGCFRSVQLRSPGNKILWKGFPAEVSAPGIAPGWFSFGEGRFELSKINPLNRLYCQHIRPAANAEAGVMQPRLDLKGRQSYTGSVWARGNIHANFSVRLISGGKTIAEKTMGGPSAVWKEYKFGLQPVENAQDASFQIVVNGGELYIDQCSLMEDSVLQSGGYRPDLYEALADLAPATLRWPGGSFAAGYNWKWGIGPQAKRIRVPKMSWDDYEQNAFGTDEYIGLCHRLHAAPIIVIPIGFDKTATDRAGLIRSAKQWIEYCNGPVTSVWGNLRAKNGHTEPYHVKYWEIDNEMWELGVQRYTTILKEFVIAMKQTDPSIQIIACGDFTEKGVYMDSVLLNSAGKYIDFLSLHHYEAAGNFVKGPGQSAMKYNHVAQLIAASPNPQIKLFISEWNASGIDMRTGLYAGSILNVFEREPAITMAAAALLFRRTDAKGWDNAFINFDAHDYFTAPNYIVARLWRKYFAPRLIRHKVDSGRLDIVATKSENGGQVNIKIVNPVGYPVDVSVHIEHNDGLSVKDFEVVSADALTDKNTMDQKDRIKGTNGTMKPDGTDVLINMPAWSAGVISFSK